MTLVRESPSSPSENSIPRNDVLFLLSFALVKLIIHALANAQGGYGYFRDEFYYLACTEHLDLGYVDHPPLSMYILALSRSVLGDSIFALRFLPALAGLRRCSSPDSWHVNLVEDASHKGWPVSSRSSP